MSHERLLAIGVLRVCLVVVVVVRRGVSQRQSTQGLEIALSLGSTFFRLQHHYTERRSDIVIETLAYCLS